MDGGSVGDHVVRHHGEGGERLVMTVVNKKGGGGLLTSCSIGCGILLVIPVLFLALCSINESCKNHSRQAQLHQSAKVAIDAAEKNTDPCSGFDEAKYPVNAVTGDIELNNRLDKLYKLCIDRECVSLENLYKEGLPSKAAIDLALVLLQRYEEDYQQQPFSESCLEHSKRIRAYSSAISTVERLKVRLVTGDDLVGLHEDIIAFVRNNDSIIREVLPPEKVHELLVPCRNKMFAEGELRFKTKDYVASEMLFTGALACDEALSQEYAWDRSSRRSTERKVQGSMSARKRAEANDERLEARCRARGEASLLCEERCDAQAERMDSEAPETLLWYMRCTERCDEMFPEECQ